MRRSVQRDDGNLARLLHIRYPTMRRYSTRPAARLATLALVAAVVAACDAPDPDGRDRTDAADTATRAPGPADGAALPATDTGRVTVGDTAPDFTLLNRHGEPVTLSELRGRQIVLVFYRGHW